jgi:cell division protein FtsB
MGTGIKMPPKKKPSTKASGTRSQTVAMPKASEPAKEGIFTRRRVGTVIAGLLAAQLLFTVIFGRNGILSYAEKRHQSSILAEQIDHLQKENSVLKDETDRLTKDPSAIEHQAREQLHYTRPGEVIYTLPTTPTKK